MPALKIISPGFLTTVQDLGRFGFAHLGVPPAGAADRCALLLGNVLVNNEGNTSALEMTLIGGTFEFEADGQIAITGADCDPVIDGQQVPQWTAMAVRPGQTLKCGAIKSGARAYLCINGGIQVPKVMGSAATHLQAGIGGWHGRQLQKGEVLSIAEMRVGVAFRPRTVRSDLTSYVRERSILRATLGPQRDFFSQDLLSLFSSTPYIVSESSNRVGLRLRGEAIIKENPAEIITEGISLGAVQVPADGQPIILFVEHPTTGGYPKIANVISADWCRVGQLRPRDVVRFQFVSLDEAHRLLRQQHEQFMQACRPVTQHSCCMIEISSRRSST
ncbi:MAG: biotin-dependent carboxyltransferase family protein [bacterium]